MPGGQYGCVQTWNTAAALCAAGVNKIKETSSNAYQLRTPVIDAASATATITARELSDPGCT